MWMLTFGVLAAFAGKPASAACLVELSPPRVVVRYGDSFSVNCTSLSNQTAGMGWESPLDGIEFTPGVSTLTLKVGSVKLWGIASLCYMNYLENGEQCIEALPITVYKMPDNVSMSDPGPMGPMVEGKQYRMQCDIANVAPARNLSVYWHRGDEIVGTQTFNESSLVPVNKSSVLDLVAHRDYNGSQIWCEAVLNFSPPGPDLSPMRSKSHEVTVLYPPAFDQPADGMQIEVPVRGQIILNCSATGNPKPSYSWDIPQPTQQMKKIHKESQLVLGPNYQFPGTYTCTTSNTQGTKTKTFSLVAAPRNRGTFAAIVGVGVLVAVLLVIVLLPSVTPGGTFSLSKGGYLRGQAASSRPV